MKKLFLIFSILVHLKTTAQQSFTDTPLPAINKTSPTDSVFKISDKMAEFPGGFRGWSKYLQKNLDYAIPLNNNAPPGRYNVIVMFIIDEKGNVNELKTLTNHGYGMEDEAIRVIEKGPRWVPAVQKGKNVKSYRKQPLTFVVGNKIK